MGAAPDRHAIQRIGRRHQPRQPEARQHAHERGYTKAWERFRLRHLSLHPLCEYCLAAGRVEPATVVDHDLPHRGDRYLFWDNTFTSLCQRHHSIDKQRAEARLTGDDLLRWVDRMKGGRCL